MNHNQRARGGVGGLLHVALSVPRHYSNTHIAHFPDMAAILNSIVLNIYYGMLRGQINMYLPPEHPIMNI